MTPPTYADALAACEGIDTSRCPDVDRNEMHCPPRCDDYDGVQREACRRLGIDPDDADARYGDRYEDIVDAGMALDAARPTCAAAGRWLAARGATTAAKGP